MKRRLKEEIRFIAVGAAGANVCQMLERQGYKAFYINLAQQDLDAINSPNKLHIKNGEGASKDRMKAKDVLAESVEEVIEVIDNQITENYIWVVFSLGGGSGSGTGVDLAMIIAENPDKKVGLVVILPSMKESLQARINAYEALAEIIKVKNDLCSIFILDNNQREDRLQINRSFATLFDSFIKVGDYTSIHGVLDTSEQKKLLETPGVAMIHKSTQDGKASMLASINTGIYTPLEPNKKVQYIGLSQSEEKPLELAAVTTTVGEPIDSFLGYGNTEAVLFLAGLSFPKTYIERLKESIQSEQERVERLLDDEEPEMDLGINFLAKKKEAKAARIEPEKKMTARERLLASRNKR